MAVISFSREASKEEMGREIDRRGAVIDALTEERDRLKQWQADQVEVIDEAKALITELNADKKALEAERDRLALANAELLAGLEMISSGSWPGIADKALSGEWKFIFSDAQKIARALLAKHKATSTEREGK